MPKPTVTPEELLGQALELPPGPAQRDFLAQHCPDPEIRREVESLLRAHEEAGPFLEPADSHDSLRLPVTRHATQGSASAAAAVHAAEFLRKLSGRSETEVAAYVDGLAAPIRREARERIEAGLRVRRLSATARAGARDDVPVPEIPGYRIEYKVGEGSLGIVYRALDQKLNRPVALKVLRPQASQAIGRRLLHEARQAAALTDPAVVTIFAVLDEASPPAIVMELVEGFPLDRFAANLNFNQKAQLLREVARGLAAAHQRGLVHRDLKPENIIVGPDMRPRILDFGLALSLEEAALQGRGFEGTPLYASPEQVRAEPLTPASDVFSFGSLMFRVLTGRPPFAGQTLGEVLEAVATTAPPLLSEAAVGVPEDLQAICLACLAWDAPDRPAASVVALELGRFLLGEPVGLRPKLYDDILRRSISEYSNQARHWVKQSMISGEERDALEIIHRRLLADEDHWIIDARRITLRQTALACGTWLAVVATGLMVWLLREDLTLPWRWLLPSFFTLLLLASGYAAHRVRETLASATFLAGAALAIAPCTLALLGELGLWGTAPQGVTQLLQGSFTNAQVLAAAATALLVSTLSWWRLKMTGFAWTTAALSAASYLSGLLVCNWLGQKPEIQALWCLPLALMEPLALWLERQGRVRWTLPFHLVGLLAVVASLDVMAWHGPTLHMLKIDTLGWPYFEHDRLQTLSFTLNGLLFLALMLLTEHSRSLDLRRASRLLEVLALLHTLASLFANALGHRGQPYVRLDVWLYVGAAVCFVVVAPFRSRWRILVGGLAGCGLGSYLLVDLGLVARQPFILGLAVAGMSLALGTFVYARRWHRRPWAFRTAPRKEVS